MKCWGSLLLTFAAACGAPGPEAGVTAQAQAWDAEKYACVPTPRLWFIGNDIVGVPEDITVYESGTRAVILVVETSGDRSDETPAGGKQTECSNRSPARVMSRQGTVRSFQSTSNC